MTVVRVDALQVEGMFKRLLCSQHGSHKFSSRKPSDAATFASQKWTVASGEAGCKQVDKRQAEAASDGVL